MTKCLFNLILFMTAIDNINYTSLNTSTPQTEDAHLLAFWLKYVPSFCDIFYAQLNLLCVFENRHFC